MGLDLVETLIVKNSEILSKHNAKHFPYDAKPCLLQV